MANPKLIQIFTEELLNLHRGQGMDLYWRDSLTCPSEADYLEMVGNKTGGLFRLAIKLMQAESAVNMYVLDHLFPFMPPRFPTPPHLPRDFSRKIHLTSQISPVLDASILRHLTAIALRSYQQ